MGDIWEVSAPGSLSSFSPPPTLAASIWDLDALQLVFSMAGLGLEHTQASGVSVGVAWLGCRGRRLVEYRFPAFGWDCLPFTLVSPEEDMVRCS